MSTVPAAAVSKGDTVTLDTGETVTVAKVGHATPTAGRITWTCNPDGQTVVVGGAQRIEFIRLP